MDDLLTGWATARGYEIAWGSVSVVAEVRDDIMARRLAGELDAKFDRERMSWFQYPEGMPMDDASSVILVAVPCPGHTVHFMLDEGPLAAVVPPTYVAYGRRRDEVRRDLASSVFQGKGRVEVLPAPLKAVAARLGLVRYGLNNIAYSACWGSYLQLVGLITDIRLASVNESQSRPPEPLSKCHSCGACRKVCPTGAVGEDRFLLHAEHCLTFHNEVEGAWPEYIAASVHHCLVGCMLCQEVCPQNAGLFLSESTEVVFSVDETATLLTCDGRLRGSVGRGILDKLKGLGLDAYAPILGRNLRALVNSIREATAPGRNTIVP
jgi:epoxyqueuosine reductase